MRSFSNYVYCHFFNFFNTEFCDLRSSGSDVLDGPFFIKSGKFLLSLQAGFQQKKLGKICIIFGVVGFENVPGRKAKVGKVNFSTYVLDGARCFF